MKDPDRNATLRKAIAFHLQAQGPKDWKLVQNQFPTISPRTFWREVKGVRDALATVVDLQPLEINSPLAANYGDGSEVVGVRAEMTSPDDFFGQVQRQFEAIDALERHCVRVTGGQPTIQNPVIYAEVIKLRAAALNMVAKHSARFLYVQNHNDFVVAILEEVRKVEDPQLGLRVAEGIRDVFRQFDPEGMTNSSHAKREQRALQRKAELEEFKRKLGEAREKKLESMEWSGRSVEVQAVLRRRLLAVLEHCQFSDAALQHFFEAPSGIDLFKNLRKEEPPFLDTFRLLRLAYLKVQPNIRINMDWFFSGGGDALLPVSTASEAQIAEAKRRSTEIALHLGAGMAPQPPAHFERFFKNLASANTATEA